MRAFADALDSVPMALAENSGLSPIETLANVKSRQAKENNSRLGVDCMQTGSNGESPPSRVPSRCFLVSPPGRLLINPFCALFGDGPNVGVGLRAARGDRRST